MELRRQARVGDGTDAGGRRSSRPLHVMAASAPDRAAHVPRAEVVVFEESSHFPWLDEPEAFTATIRHWLEQQGVL
jgi:pimeloyl-ACP methyl ester carboxylesterase